jgi:hypothetical protein
MEDEMECLICKKSNEVLLEENSKELDKIDKVLSIMKDKIKEIENNTQDTQTKFNVNEKKNYSNCLGKTGDYCQDCSFSEPVDDKGYFWCEKYKITFINDEEKEKRNKITKLNREIIKLEAKKNNFKNIDIEDLEIQNDNDDDYFEILAKYFPGEKVQCEKELKINICKNCLAVLNKIVENKINGMMDEIVEQVREEIEEKENDK